MMYFISTWLIRVCCANTKTWHVPGCLRLLLPGEVWCRLAELSLDTLVDVQQMADSPMVGAVALLPTKQYLVANWWQPSPVTSLDLSAVHVCWNILSSNVFYHLCGIIVIIGHFSTLKSVANIYLASFARLMTTQIQEATSYTTCPCIKYCCQLSYYHQPPWSKLSVAAFCVNYFQGLKLRPQQCFVLQYVQAQAPMTGRCGSTARVALLDSNNTQPSML